MITYEEEDNYFVTHRIIDKNKTSFITKGDNNNEKDTEVKASKIIGKVIFSSLFLGALVRIYLKYIFIGITIFVIFINLFCIYQEKIKGKDENAKGKNKETE